MDLLFVMNSELVKRQSKDLIAKNSFNKIQSRIMILFIICLE